jgi:hypothetical protein
VQHSGQGQRTQKLIRFTILTRGRARRSNQAAMVHATVVDEEMCG